MIEYSFDKSIYTFAKSVDLIDPRGMNPNPKQTVYIPQDTPPAKYWKITLKTFYTETGFSGLMRVKIRGG